MRRANSNRYIVFDALNIFDFRFDVDFCVSWKCACVIGGVVWKWARIGRTIQVIGNRNRINKEEYSLIVWIVNLSNAKWWMFHNKCASQLQIEFETSYELWNIHAYSGPLVFCLHDQFLSLFLFKKKKQQSMNKVDINKAEHSSVVRYIFIIQTSKVNQLRPR